MAKFVPANTIPIVIASSTAQESKAATELESVENPPVETVLSA
jgi:hypothetical protein